MFAGLGAAAVFVSHFLNFCLEIITLTCTIHRGMKFATQISPLLNFWVEKISLNFVQVKGVKFSSQTNKSFTGVGMVDLQ